MRVPKQLEDKTLQYLQSRKQYCELGYHAICSKTTQKIVRVDIINNYQTLHNMLSPLLLLQNAMTSGLWGPDHKIFCKTSHIESRSLKSIPSNDKRKEL